MRDADHDLLPTLTEAGADDVTVLALTAMRLLAAGYASGDVACWDAAHDGAERMLGPRDGQRLVAGMTGVMRAIRTERLAGWTFMPACCGRVTSDEHDLIRALALARAGRRRDLAVTAGRIAGISRGSTRLLPALRIMAELLDQLAPVLRGEDGPQAAARADGTGAYLH